MRPIIMKLMRIKSVIFILIISKGCCVAESVYVQKIAKCWMGNSVLCILR
jgi:hypothetical protein